MIEVMVPAVFLWRFDATETPQGRDSAGCSRAKGIADEKFEPAYLKLHRQGQLTKRAEELWEILKECTLCPRKTRKNRLAGETDVCGLKDEVKVQNAIRAHLMKIGKPAFVEESFLSFEEALTLVLELGGIPCYPTLADGASPICAYEDPVERLIEALRAPRAGQA